MSRKEFSEFQEISNSVSSLIYDFKKRWGCPPTHLLAGKCQYEIFKKESFRGQPVSPTLEMVNGNRKKPWRMMGLEIIEVNNTHLLEVCYMTL